MKESFEATRARLLQTWVPDHWNRLGFECDLAYAFEDCGALTFEKVVQTSRPECMFLTHCRARVADREAVEKEVIEAFERRIRYSGETRWTVAYELDGFALRFVTRSPQSLDLVATGEIRVWTGESNSTRRCLGPVPSSLCFAD